MKLNNQLSEVINEASSLQTKRDELAELKRKYNRSIRDHATKMKDVCGQIKEKENEKQCLEKARENCLAM